MSDPNFAEQAGGFMADAKVNIVADNLINQGRCDCLLYFWWGRILSSNYAQRLIR